MIKISSWICGICLIAWIIFVVFIIKLLSSVRWDIISIVSVCVGIGSFALSYLGGHIIRGNKGAIRLGMLISVLWVVVNFLDIEPSFGRHIYRYKQWIEFFKIGFIPVMSYWGILWVISGFLPKNKKMENL